EFFRAEVVAQNENDVGRPHGRVGGAKRWRCDDNGKRDDCEEAMERGHTDLPLKEMWFDTFRIHERRAPRNRKRRAVSVERPTPNARSRRRVACGFAARR